jgi:hypothetical protein
MDSVESFWPETLGGWVGVAAGVVATATTLVAAIGWLWPWVRRRLGLTTKQDIRVKVSPMVNLHDRTNRQLCVTVENHSDRDFFLKTISLHEGHKGGIGIAAPADSVTGQINNGGTIAAGNSIPFYMPLDAVLRAQEKLSLRYAVATSRVGVDYRSPDGELERALKEATGDSEANS